MYVCVFGIDDHRSWHDYPVFPTIHICTVYYVDSKDPKDRTITYWDRIHDFSSALGDTHQIMVVSYRSWLVDLIDKPHQHRSGPGEKHCGIRSGLCRGPGGWQAGCERSERDRMASEAGGRFSDGTWPFQNFVR